MGVCSRMFLRYTDGYEENGLEGLLDKRLTQASFHRTPEDEVMAVAEWDKTRYMEWNAKHKCLEIEMPPAYSSCIISTSLTMRYRNSKRWTTHLLQNRTILFVDNISK